MPSEYIRDAVASFDGTFTTDPPLGSPTAAVTSVLRHMGCNTLMCAAVAAELAVRKAQPKNAGQYHIPYSGEDVRAILLTLTGDNF